MKILTLTTDFGLRDSYVAEMRGVFLSCCPDAVVVDVTHAVGQGDLTAASFLLKGAYRYFDDGALHLVVVDPGVGTGRDILLVETAHFLFVGPDNGVLYEACAEDTVGAIYALDTSAFPRTLGEVFDTSVIRRLRAGGVSRTFHGRDLFSPLAAYLLQGHPPGEVMREKSSMVRLDLPKPKIGKTEVSGEILFIDGFGNLITNIPAAAVRSPAEVFISVGGEVRSLGSPKSAYAEAKRADPLAIVGSRGYLEIGVNGGNARDTLGAGRGDGVLLIEKSG
jgi:S-adenosylmethionine hydrolase